MASVHIIRRRLASGCVRYRVRYRLGGAESRHRYGGSFTTLREAEARKRWIAGELAARRVPDLSALEEAAPAVTLAAVAERWIASRLDTSASTVRTYGQAFARLGRLGDLEPAAVRPIDVQQWIAGMAADASRLPASASTSTPSAVPSTPARSSRTPPGADA